MEHDHEKDLEDNADRLIWERPYYIRNFSPFIPKISDTSQLPALDSFNAVKIAIDGKPNADLNWSDARRIAKEAIERGLLLFWEIDLGLFSCLPFSLSHQPQFRTLEVSLDHFRATLWKEFYQWTLGLSLYRGPLDFSTAIKWEKEPIEHLQGWLSDQFQNTASFAQETGIDISDFGRLSFDTLTQSAEGRRLLKLFGRNVATDYWHLLTGSLPGALNCFVLLDSERVENPLECALLLHRECYPRLHFAVKDCLIPFDGLLWEKGKGTSSGFIAKNPLCLNEPMQASIGVCLPSALLCRKQFYDGIEKAVEQLVLAEIPFRFLPESLLTTEWDGLDEILINPMSVSAQGKRKLQGFCAAGGTVISTTQQRLGLPLEIGMDNWDCKKRGNVRHGGTNGIKETSR